MKKRKLLGEGYIWFTRTHGSREYDGVSLTKEPSGTGIPVPIKVGQLGGWQKVRLYAEYVPRKRR